MNYFVFNSSRPWRPQEDSPRGTHVTENSKWTLSIICHKNGSITNMSNNEVKSFPLSFWKVGSGLVWLLLKMSHILVLNGAVCSPAPGKLDPSVAMYLAYLNLWFTNEMGLFCVWVGKRFDSYRAIRNWDLVQLFEILPHRKIHLIHCLRNYQKLKIKY